MNGFPWTEAMQFGFGVLKLDPDRFWAMTPRELQSAYDAWTGRRGGARPMERARLDALMAAHPDNKETMNG